MGARLGQPKAKCSALSFLSVTLQATLRRVLVTLPDSLVGDTCRTSLQQLLGEV
jgi:hypothetical protein